MAKLMSKKTKEIVQTSTVLVLAALFIIFYIVYPLITVRKLVSRPDGEKFEDPEFVLENDPSFFTESGLYPDTFTVVTDDNTRLAGLYFQPDTTLFDTVAGTVILIHKSDTNRTSLSSYISPLLDSGWAVALYDQRACGLSGARYHSPGEYEAEDLNQMIVHLKFHERLFQPLITIGFGLGADAAIYASEKEERIDRIVAAEPSLTFSRWIAKLKKEKGSLWIPLYKMVYFWWYRKIIGFPYDRTGIDDIRPVAAKTLLILNSNDLDSDEATRFREVSGEMVTVLEKPADEQQLRETILGAIYSRLE